MAKSVEQIVQEQLGSLLLQNAKLASELDHAREEIAKRDADAEKAKEATSTTTH